MLSITLSSEQRAIQTSTWLTTLVVGDDRERGATETWTFEDTADIGDFRCLRIRMEGSDGWDFDSVSHILVF